MSAGDERKGPRLYHWAYIQTTDPALPDVVQGANWLLIRGPSAPAPARRPNTPFTAPTHPRQYRCAPWSRTGIR